MQECVKALNRLLRQEPALYEKQFTPGGFQWVELNHRDDCVMVYKRVGRHEDEDLLVVLNMNPIPKEGWQIEVTREYKREIFNSDDAGYWGTGNYLNREIRCERVDENEPKYRLVVNLPPLAAIILK
jgi:1,4-alpha-glucan branching enzyme